MPLNDDFTINEPDLPDDWWRGKEARCPICGDFIPPLGLRDPTTIQYYCHKCIVYFTYDDRALFPVEPWQRGLSLGIKSARTLSCVDSRMQVETIFKTIIESIERETGSRVYARLLL